MGSSIIKRAWLHARIRNRPGCTNLTLERHGINLWWQGYSGMRLNHLKSKLRTLSSLEDTPDVIVLHVAGNDLGAYEIGDLRYFLRAQLRYNKRNNRNTKLIWSQILPRTNWRHSKNNEAMEKARKRLNSYAATRTIGMGGAYIKYPNMFLANTELWSADGIHLSNVGNERFLNSLQHALENIVLHGAVVYP